MHSKTWIETGRNPRARNAVVSAVRALLCGLSGGVGRARQRRQLVHLTDHQLRDIGLCRADVEFEGHKSFWRR